MQISTRKPVPPPALVPSQAELHDLPTCPVLYMGIPYPIAKRVGKVWYHLYHLTSDGYKPFVLQGRVRPVVEPQLGPR
jgi:hypothetical protein